MENSRRVDEINGELRTIDRDIARYRENIREAEASGYGSVANRVRETNEPRIRDAESRRERLDRERRRLLGLPPV